MEEIAVLWSGGIDSTVMVPYLVLLDYEVQPYYINRGTNGRTRREVDAVRNMYGILASLFPRVREPIYLEKKIGKSEDRNERMIDVLKERGVKRVALGSYKDCRYPDDNDGQLLSLKTGIEVLTLDDFDVHSKSDVIDKAVDLEIYKFLRHTWSCQNWFKKQCGICFSCKRRRECLGDLGEDFVYKTLDDSLRYISSLQRAATGINPEEVKKEAERIASVPRVGGKFGNVTRWRLHSEDVALCKMICEKLNIPADQYTFGNEPGGYFFYFSRSIGDEKKWEEFNRIEEEYRKGVLIGVYVGMRLKDYFSRNSYIREKKLIEIIAGESNQPDSEMSLVTFEPKK
jgi:7-cyano-7-deazaguanine synthase in queuosine biosynthesis